jgi:hypothetical protein
MPAKIHFYNAHGRARVSNVCHQTQKGDSEILLRKYRPRFHNGCGLVGYLVYMRSKYAKISYYAPFAKPLHFIFRVYLALVFSSLVLFSTSKNRLFYVEKHRSACKVRGLRSMHIHVESYLKHIRSI